MGFQRSFITWEPKWTAFVTLWLDNSHLQGVFHRFPAETQVFSKPLELSLLTVFLIIRLKSHSFLSLPPHFLTLFCVLSSWWREKGEGCIFHKISDALEAKTLSCNYVSANNFSIWKPVNQDLSCNWLWFKLQTYKGRDQHRQCYTIRGWKLWSVQGSGSKGQSRVSNEPGLEFMDKVQLGANRASGKTADKTAE